MREAQWLRCLNPDKMLTVLPRKASMWLERKYRLFGCACVRRLSRIVRDDPLLEVLSGIEDAVDQPNQKQRKATLKTCVLQSWQAGPGVFNSLREAVQAVAHPYAKSGAKDSAKISTHILWRAAREQLPAIIKREREAQAHLLRDIFGPLPFRAVTVASQILTWNDCTVVKLAQPIYEERAFDRLPILADALEEAGCTNEEILNHLRQPAQHVRGCWILDLLTQKEQQ